MESKTTKLPRGIRNNNPLNIRVGNNWKGEVSVNTDGAFEQFQTIRMGMRAGLKLLRNYISGWDGKRVPVKTVDAIIRKWAPPSENATKKYLDTVVAHSGLARQEIMYPNDKQKICKLAQAMMFVECGQESSIKDWMIAWDLM